MKKWLTMGLGVLIIALGGFEKSAFMIVAGDDHKCGFFDTDPTHRFEPNITDLEPPGKGNGRDTQSPDPAGTAIFTRARLRS